VHGLSTEDAYRIVQLAAFNAFEPDAFSQELRSNPCDSFEKADSMLFRTRDRHFRKSQATETIQRIISHSRLRVSAQLDASKEDVERWNGLLNKIFTLENWSKWDSLFSPLHLLKNEAVLYKQILGDD